MTFDATSTRHTSRDIRSAMKYLRLYGN